MTAARSVEPASDLRRALLAKTSIAAKELGIDEETFRDLLERKFGVRSRTEMSGAQLAELVEHFRTQGWKDRPKRTGDVRRPAGETRPELSKIRALWISGWHLGVVADRSDAALAAFAKRVTGGTKRAGRLGIDRLEWLDAAASYQVIEALKAWLAREGGVDWSPFGQPYRPSDRVLVIQAQWRRLHALGEVGDVSPAGLRAEIALVLGRAAVEIGRQLDDPELDRLIQHFGAWIRRALGERKSS